ncbi:hypothetical protein [Sphingomonas glacialis]|uniref:hypothetical protein n=1 Tax=Sphingomonas glacialis TaxID=658225 RepID=UPI0013A53531|nr:hypothetical protein [Sphingomonas glacialis]
MTSFDRRHIFRACVGAIALNADEGSSHLPDAAFNRVWVALGKSPADTGVIEPSRGMVMQCAHGRPPFLA